MDVDIGGLRNDILGRVGSVVDLAALEELRVAALGKRGSVTELVKRLGDAPSEHDLAEQAALLDTAVSELGG